MPLIKDIKSQCKLAFGMDEDEQIEVAKHVHHNFEWKWLNEDEEVTEKGKKGKSKTSKMGEMDIRRFPVLLTDG